MKEYDSYKKNCILLQWIFKSYKCHEPCRLFLNFLSFKNQGQRNLVSYRIHKLGIIIEKLFLLSHQNATLRSLGTPFQMKIAAYTHNQCTHKLCDQKKKNKNSKSAFLLTLPYIESLIYLSKSSETF